MSRIFVLCAGLLALLVKFSDAVDADVSIAVSPEAPGYDLGEQVVITCAIKVTDINPEIKFFMRKIQGGDVVAFFYASVVDVDSPRITTEEEFDRGIASNMLTTTIRDTKLSDAGVYECGKEDSGMTPPVSEGSKNTSIVIYGNTGSVDCTTTATMVEGNSYLFNEAADVKCVFKGQGSGLTPKISRDSVDVTGQFAEEPVTMTWVGDTAGMRTGNYEWTRMQTGYIPSMNETLKGSLTSFADREVAMSELKFYLPPVVVVKLPAMLVCTGPAQLEEGQIDQWFECKVKNVADADVLGFEWGVFDSEGVTVKLPSTYKAKDHPFEAIEVSKTEYTLRVIRVFSYLASAENLKFTASVNTKDQGMKSSEMEYKGILSPTGSGAVSSALLSMVLGSALSTILL